MFVFDLDGTIYLGDRVLPGARDLITALQAQGKAVRFLSNNPTRHPHQYVDKLQAMGIPAEAGTVVTSGSATARWLATHEPGAVVFPIGEEVLADQLRAEGVPLSDDPAAIDIVVASYDRRFTYAKLQIAFDALWRHGRARLFATNRDGFCPLPGGNGEPDSGAIVAAIEACSGKACERVVGKPEPAILGEAIEGLATTPDRCFVVGDRLTTDVRLARNVGAGSALVLTGDADRDDVARADTRAHPDHVLETLDDLHVLLS